MIGRRRQGQWPKTVVPLPPDLEAKRQAWHEYWLQRYPQRFSFVTEFNVRFLSRLPRRSKAETVLEIGPGWESTVRELLRPDDTYYCCDDDARVCAELRRKLPEPWVLCGDVQQLIPMVDASVDRVVALHVLEHLPDLPAALAEIRRVLKPEGCLDVVIPCEGSLLYSVGRELSSARLFRKRFGKGFRAIMRAEHVNRASEIVRALVQGWSFSHHDYFPFPQATLGVRWNLLAGFRVRPISVARAHD
jgi:ubiquinone/menaquinone biosynthesis C-methylase UbiE